MSTYEAKDLHLTNCRSIQWNLLELLVFSKDPLASSGFVRELEETTRCDHIADFSKLRESFHVRIGEDALKRVNNFEETLLDEKKCTQAILHHQAYTKSLLVDCLSPYDKACFYSRARIEELTAAISFFVLGVPVYRGLRAMVRKSAENQERLRIFAQK